MLRSRTSASAWARGEAPPLGCLALCGAVPVGCGNSDVADELRIRTDRSLGTVTLLSHPLVIKATWCCRNSPTSPCAARSSCSPCSAAAEQPRIWRSSSCATSSPCCVASSHVPGWTCRPGPARRRLDLPASSTSPPCFVTAFGTRSPRSTGPTVRQTRQETLTAVANLQSSVRSGGASQRRLAWIHRGSRAQRCDLI